MADRVTSAFSKSSVFFCPYVHAKTAFSKSSTLKSVFVVFIDRFRRMRVDGSRIHKEKYAFSNQNRYVWTGLRLLCAFFLATDRVKSSVLHYVSTFPVMAMIIHSKCLSLITVFVTRAIVDQM